MIPKGWRRVRLGELFSSLEGGVSLVAQDRKAKDGEIGILKTSSTSSGRFLPDENKALLSGTPHNVRVPVKKGALLFNRKNTPELVGSSVYVDVDCPNLFLPDLIWQATVDSAIGSAKWLGYVMQLSSIKAELKRKANGTAQSMMNITKPSLLSVYVELPPLAEQARIVSILSCFEGMNEMLFKLIRTKMALKKALMQQLLTGKVRFKEFGKPAKHGELPKGWKSVHLGSALRGIVGGGTPDRGNNSYWTGTIPWASVKDLSNGNTKDTIEHISENGLKASAACLVPKGTNIVATRMAVGARIRYECDVAINQDLKALIPSGDLHADYLQYILEASALKLSSLGTGSTVNGIRLNDIRRIRISLPILSEQTAIALTLDACDNEITLLKQQRAALQLQKKGLMQKLLTGRIRVKV